MMETLNTVITFLLGMCFGAVLVVVLIRIVSKLPPD
jgi:hypothetical protein